MVFHHHLIHFLWPLGEFWCHCKNILLTELCFVIHNCCRLFRSTEAPYCVPDQTENLEYLPGGNSLQNPAEWPCVGGLACSDLGQQKCYLTTACRKCNWMIIWLANTFWFHAKSTIIYKVLRAGPIRLRGLCGVLVLGLLYSSLPGGEECGEEAPGCAAPRGLIPADSLLWQGSFL